MDGNNPTLNNRVVDRVRASPGATIRGPPNPEKWVVHYGRSAGEAKLESTVGCVVHKEPGALVPQQDVARGPHQLYSR